MLKQIEELNEAEIAAILCELSQQLAKMATRTTQKARHFKAIAGMVHSAQKSLLPDSLTRVISYGFDTSRTAKRES